QAALEGQTHRCVTQSAPRGSLLALPKAHAPHSRIRPARPHSSPRSVARAGHAPTHDRAVSATHESLRAHVHDHAFLARTVPRVVGPEILVGDRKSTRLNSSHVSLS